LNTRDYLTVGLKLLGVLFFVLGLVVAAMTLLNFGIQTYQRAFPPGDVLFSAGGSVITLMSAAQPVAYLICGYLLTRKTEWCLKLIGYPPEGA